MSLKSLLPLLVATASLQETAGPYTDDLSKCLVESTNKQDRIDLVRWIFAAAAANPAVASLANVTPKAMDEADTATGALFTRLLTESCKEKAKAAITYEDSMALQTSFQLLGQVAAGELFASPEVRQAVSGLQAHVDAKKLEELKK